MRKYKIKLSVFGISNYRYQELKAFCMQYPEKKWKIRNAQNLKAVNHGEIHGSGTSDPTLASYLSVAREIEDCRKIDAAAMAVQGGKWSSALIKNVCYGVGYEKIAQHEMPTASRNAFFNARRDFFVILNELLTNKDK